MGRGDKKTAKGKRFKGSFGKSRPHNKPTNIVKVEKEVAVVEEVKPVKKAKAKTKEKEA